MGRRGGGGGDAKVFGNEFHSYNRVLYHAINVVWPYSMSDGSLTLSIFFKLIISFYPHTLILVFICCSQNSLQ